MELARVSYPCNEEGFKAILRAVQANLLTFAAVGMKGVLRSEVHKESSAGLGKPERIVLCRDDVRIDRRLYSSLES